MKTLITAIIVLAIIVAFAYILVAQGIIPMNLFKCLATCCVCPPVQLP